MIRKIRNFLAVAAIAAAPIATLLAPGIAHAATFTCTWTGAADSTFANAANWSGCNSDFPQTADTNDLVFPVSVTNKTITVPAGYTFNSITFNGTGSGGYALSGSAFTLAGNVTDSSGQSNGIANDVVVNGSSTIDVSASQDLTIGGTVSGTGSIIKTGAGDLVMRTLTLTGALTINGGMFTSQATSAADSTVSGVTVASGATFAYNPFDFSSVTTYTFSKPITSAGTLDFSTVAAGSGLTLNLTSAITLTGDSEIDVQDGTTVHITGALHGPGFVLSAVGGSVLNESTDNTTNTPSGELIAGDTTDSDAGADAPDTGSAYLAAHPLTTLAATIAAAGAIFAAARMTRKSASRR